MQYYTNTGATKFMVTEKIVSDFIRQRIEKEKAAVAWLHTRLPPRLKYYNTFAKECVFLEKGIICGLFSRRLGIALAICRHWS